MNKICSIFLLTVVALLMIGAPGHAQKKDNDIESSAKQLYVFEADRKADDIKIKAVDGAVPLTGSVFEESPTSLALETVPATPDVKRRVNRPEVKGVPPAPAPPLRLRIVTEESLKR